MLTGVSITCISIVAEVQVDQGVALACYQDVAEVQFDQGVA